MSTPAFPVSALVYNEQGKDPTTIIHDGMTLRDYFAAKAMQADMSTYSEDLIYEKSEWFEARATQWYAVADAMLKARKA
jgi:hypothetical protein